MSGYQETSGIAYDSIKESLGPKQRLVLWAFQSQGDMTDKELVDCLGWPINCITGRRGELVEKKIIGEKGIKKSTNGKPSIVWGVI